MGGPGPNTPEQEHDGGVLEQPTPSARVKVDRLGLTVECEVPGKHAGKLLDVTGGAIAATAAAVGPSLTLNVLPAGFPAWMTFTIVMAQLAVSGLVVLRIHRKRESASR